VKLKVSHPRKQNSAVATWDKQERTEHEGVSEGDMDYELNVLILPADRLCVLVVRVPGYRSRGPGSIPGATGFSEK
jgi:hypothetical protein